VLEDYAQLLVDGVTFPPVVVFFDGVTRWLADGYHRWHAHKALGLAEISAEVRQGSKREALLFSLSANALHGQRREPGDYRKGYGIIVRNGLAEPWDADAIQRLLGCTGRWALDLTKKERDRLDRQKTEAISLGLAAGKTTTEIARQLGVHQSTVTRRARLMVPDTESYAITKTSKTHNDSESPGERVRRRAALKAELDELGAVENRGFPQSR
jgi:transposase-like protein